MANETLKIDANNKPVAGAVTDDSNLDIRMLRIDDVTKGLKVSIVGGGGTGTVISITQGTGILLSPSPITTTGSVSLATSLQPAVTLTGNALKYLRVNAGETAVEYAAVAGGGITIGTTTITSGNTTRILYNNAGVVGEYTLTGSGTVVAMATSPTFQTSINGAYLTASQILGTDVSSNIVSLPVATYPSLTELAFVKGVTSAIQTQINAKGAGTVTAIGVTTANGVSGSSSGGATPNLTITLGAISPTTVNGNTFTTGTYTLTGTAGKTLNFTNSITLSGTDSTTMTFPSTTATIARTDAGQTFTGVQTMTSPVMVTSIDTSSASFTAFAGATTLMTIGGTGASASSFFPSTLDTSSSVTGAIRTSGGISAAKSANIGTTLTVGTGYQIGGAAASGKILVGNGTNFVASTPTFPNASATSGKIIKSDGTNWVASTETYATPSTSGNVLTSDGTNWLSSAPSGGGTFPAQDIGISTGSTVVATSNGGTGMTSNTTGTVMFYAECNATNTTLNIYRLVRDGTTGNYYETHTTALTISASALGGLMVAGSFLYVWCNIAGVGAIRRYAIADLSGVTSMTGTIASYGAAGTCWSDGTNLYLYTGTTGSFNKYTISGTAVTDTGAVAFTSAGVSPNGVSDGTNVWLSDTFGNGTMNIRKYPVAGGAVTSTTTFILHNNTWLGAQSGSFDAIGYFLAGSNVLGLGWQFNWCSATAVVGLGIHLMGIALP